jgi:hypothetical protein
MVIQGLLVYKEIPDQPEQPVLLGLLGLPDIKEILAHKEIQG